MWKREAVPIHDVYKRQGFIGVGGTAFEFLTNASIGKVLIFLCVIILLQFRPKGIFAISSRALEE